MKSYRLTLIFLLLPLLGLGQIQFVSFQEEESNWQQTEECLEVVLVFEVAHGYHIQANEVPEHLIATELNLNNSSYSIQEIFFPNPKPMYLGKESKIWVFDGRFEIVLHLRSSEKSIISGSSISGTLSYQACDDHKCFFPRTLNFLFKPQTKIAHYGRAPVNFP